MKKLFVLMLLLCSTFTYAGGYDTLTGDDKNIARRIKIELGVSDIDAYNIYVEFVKSHFDTDDWHYSYYDNGSLSASKVENSKNKMLLMNIVNENRYVNFTFVKFYNERQVLIQSIETLPRSSSSIIDKYNSMKTDEKYKTSVENLAFAVFNKKGYTSKVKTLVYSGNGAIQFTNFNFYNLK